MILNLLHGKGFDLGAAVAADLQVNVFSVGHFSADTLYKATLVPIINSGDFDLIITKNQ